MRGSEKDGEKFVNQVCTVLKGCLTQHLTELIDDTETRTLLETHQAVAEDLIHSVVPQMISVTALTTILRELVHERVSVRELSAILQSIAEWHVAGEKGKITSVVRPSVENGVVPQLQALSVGRAAPASEMKELLADVRIGLRRAVSRSIADPSWNVSGWVLAPEVDHFLSKVAFAGSPLEPTLAEQLIQSTKTKTQGIKKGEVAVILTTKYARSTLAALIREDCPHARVIAFEELSREVRLSVRGKITLRELEEDSIEAEEFHVKEMEVHGTTVQ